MKNFILAVALACLLLPVVAFGQVAECEGCDHQLSVYYGSGGLIAETDADVVNWRATCDRVTRTGSLEPDDHCLLYTSPSPRDS